MEFARKIFQRKYFLFFFSLLLIGGLFVFSNHVFAQGDAFGVKKVGSLLPLGGEDIRVIAAKIIRIFLSLLGIIAVGLILYAGFTWMTSGGNEEKIASAKKTLTNATIGLVIIMSSFAITQFILGKLGDATGFGQGADNDVQGGAPVPVCANFADCQANAGGPRECGDESFVVKSLTPRTPTNNGTGITNTMVRVVFSRPLDDGQDLDKIFKLTKENNSISVKNVKILPGRQIVEAFFGENTNLCIADGDDRGCLSPGNYRIEINPDLVAGGLKLQTRLSCGSFDTTANFTVNQDFIDDTKPTVPSITFNGKNTREGQVVGRSARYRLNATFEDRVKNAQNVMFGGISYMQLRVQSEPMEANAPRVDWSYYSGPKNSSNESFSFGQDLVFAADSPVPALYTLNFIAGDIDSNRTVATSSFILDGELCHNGRQDDGETAVDVGGKCLGAGACRADWQCLSGQCGPNGECINRPIIRDIDVGGNDPGSWDGAPGSWATIIGNFFGEESGTVDFGIDNNRDGTIDQWVPAPFAACNGLDVWHENMVIVEIPNIPAGTSTTIRLKTRAVGDKPSYEDQTTDDNGPKAGPSAGIFKVSNNDHPGLCAVLGPSNTNIASSSAPVTAFGRGLGNGGNNSALLFGGVNAPIRQWNDTTILSSVPANMRAGRVDVRAQVGDQTTNGVPFTVIDKDTDLVPRIESLSPSQTSTLGSLLTVTGARFGAPGTVYLATSKDAALQCAATTDNAVEAACVRLDLLTLPEACGNTWSDTQIIGKIPGGIPLQKYFVVVKNDSNHSSDAEANITLVEGNPLPGLCRLDPNTGVAPLPANSDPLTLTGINLSANTKLYFWSINAFRLNSTNNLDVAGNSVIRSITPDGTQLKTILPVGADGVSMTTGPILAQVGDNFSNAVKYTVNDCTLGGNAPGPNYQCCSNGPEKGLWKSQAFACAGETRSAGYVWRFTTGLIPQVPRVLEACNVEDWNDLSVDNFVRPSPSPWQGWGVGDACTDSIITVQFNMHMSDANLESAVKVYTCGQGNTPECTYDAATDVTENYIVGFLGGVQTDILEIRPRAGGTHLSTTWHRVILGNGLRANEPGLVQFGNNRVNTSPLAIQRPLAEPVNGITVAYNFDFKTNNARCSLFGAAITPPTYTTHLLGMIQNPGFPISTNFDAPPHPYYYYVWGRGNQACSVVDVNGKGFEWKPRQGNAGDAMFNFGYATRSDNMNVPVTSSLYADGIRATVTALQNTLLDPVVITATTDTIVDGVRKQVSGSSNLFIQLGDPVAADWWPRCDQSCTNVNIGVKFNLPMRVDTYHGALKVRKCLGAGNVGENCVDLDPLEGLPFEDINAGGFDPFQYEINVGDLELDTLYQVSLSDQILSYAGTVNGQVVSGKPVAPKTWNFKTKLKDGICILDTVDVVPSSFVATLVGQKKSYGASPLSAPNECSAVGQRLNPWAYGWNWTVENPDQDHKVAEVSDFRTKGRPAAFCSGNCLPLGSDIAFGQTAYLCGNGAVDPGEDCDVAIVGERPGTSCTLNCLRPGNKNTTTTVNFNSIGYCGNGVVEQNVGEECDPGVPGEVPYCSTTCNWKGSSKEFSDEVNSLQCGNGLVGLAENGLALLGEECDGGISLAEAGAHPEWSGIGCSQNCLHEGTKLSRAYCENHDGNNLTSEQEQSDSCFNSSTICGDGNIDPGEECERDTNNNQRIKVVLPNGNVDFIEVESGNAVCSNRCLLQNACALQERISSDFVCSAGSAGCNNDCTKTGSSALFNTPSLCGDGNLGTGENPRCEPQDLQNAPDVQQDPLQVVTAIGNGPVNPNTLMQEVKIAAQALSVRRSATNTQSLVDNNIVGKGDYALQCGYVEYPASVVDNGVIRSNNCPDATQGVGANSCCEPRPTRTAEFPVHGTGVGVLAGNNAEKVCRNTLITAQFNGELSEETVLQKVQIASLHPADYNCTTSNETAITGQVNGLLALSGEDIPQNIFVRAWNNVKHFFADIFNSVVHAVPADPHFDSILQNKIAGKVWCTGKIVPNVSVAHQPHEDGTATTTLLSMYINDVLDADTLYAVILKGGNTGMTNINGVGIQGYPVRNDEHQFHTDDVFVFETGSQICRVGSVNVDPPQKLFNAPNRTYSFTANILSTTGVPIVSTPGYAWEWNWEPHDNAFFTFPAVRNRTNINIASKNLEGTVVGTAQATITEDATQVETGRIFAGLTNLTSLFCENPWPSLSTYPYEDGVTFSTVAQTNNDNYNLQTNRFDGRAIPKIILGNNQIYLNFSFGYCADAGKTGDKSDDLPFLRPVVQGNLAGLESTCSITGRACLKDTDCPRVGFRAQTCVQGAEGMSVDLPQGTLKKFLLFNNKNEDAIGIQVFANPKRQTAREWFIDQQFSGIEKYQNVVVDGYDAITDGNNTYINALNELPDKQIHSYIYLIGVNADAQPNTRQVLEKIMSRFSFNINISERKSCILGNGTDGGQYVPNDVGMRGISAISCTTDFDCRTALGVPTSTTNGICANAKTKFQRDWTRLLTIQDAQAKLEDVHTRDGSYPLLAAGTYVPGYTNTHWPSWSRFIASVGSIPTPEVNQWSACGHCSELVGGKQVACTSDTECVNAGSKCVLPDDLQTCWNTAEATFICPMQSSVLEYKNINANAYTLYLPLEYFNSANANQFGMIKGMVSMTHYSPRSYCGENGVAVIHPAEGKCGNGVLDAGEQCDPPGTSNPVVFACPDGQTAYESCNAACRYEEPVCRAGGFCGNGRIDQNSNPPEQCDDGNLNGTYGHCSSSCTPPQPQNDAQHLNAGFCGDGIRNFDDKNHNGSKENNEAFFEHCDTAEPKFVGFGYCSQNPLKWCGTRNPATGEQVQNVQCGNNEGFCKSLGDPTYHVLPLYPTCAANCQSFGGYCGDGQLQIVDEECDDGNSVGSDGCSRFCKIENLACIEALSPNTIREQGNNTVVTIQYGQRAPEQCTNTDGVHICGGLGLSCLDTKVSTFVGFAPAECGVDGNGVVDRGCALQGGAEYEMRSFEGDACSHVLNNPVGVDVEIWCSGHRQGAQAADNVDAEAGSCGNSVVDAGEACDTGEHNGKICYPEYDRSCTYCAADCKKVLTRDAMDTCGNGKIDIDGRLPLQNGHPQPEVCDINVQTGEVVVPNMVVLNQRFNNLDPNVDLGTDFFHALFNVNQFVARCVDKGAYACENSCRTLVTNCVGCETSDNAGKPIPKLAVLNVLTPEVDPSQPQNLNTTWGSDTDRYLLRINTNTPATVKALGSTQWGWTNLSAAESYEDSNHTGAGDPLRWRQYKQDFNGRNYNQIFWVASSRHAFPLDRDFGFKTSQNENGPWSAQETEIRRGIETNPLCKDEYGLYFNLGDVTERLGGSRTNVGPTLNQVGSKAQYLRYGSIFPYPVNGELREVANEMVLSPAVPPGTFRVVVRWKNIPNAGDVTFSPVIYNRALLNNPGGADLDTRLAGSVDALRAISKSAYSAAHDNPIHNWVCKKMRLNHDYWMTSLCESFKAPGAGGNNDGSIFMHADGKLLTIAASAATIVTGKYDGSSAVGHFNSPYAIFVEAITPDGAVPMSSFNNLDVIVEIYESHSDQIPGSSLYLPDHVYSLRSAAASSNAGISKYWHVANLVKDPGTSRYGVQQIVEPGFNNDFPHGALDTGFADVLCRVPGERCERDQ